MRRARAWARLGGLGLVIVLGIVLVRYTPLGEILGREGAMDAIEYLRGSAWAPILFVLLYTVATALALPGTILTLTGGVVFGFWGGVLFNSIGANLGASAAFLLSRVLGRQGVRGLLRGESFQKYMDRLDETSREHGFRGLLTLRLIPLVPFNILNFGSGLTAMSWGTYATATAIGILPATAVYTFFADALLQGSQEASREAFLRALVAGLLLVLLSLLPTLLKKMKISLPGTTALILGFAATPIAGPLAAQGLPEHTAFDTVLSEVVEQPLVDYERLTELRGELEAYIASLGSTDPETLRASPREVRLAFWINAYNACMLKVVADHYPLGPGDAGLFGSIRNLLAGYPSNSVWQIRDVFTRSHCSVAGRDRSQDEIEHEIIRPSFGEPRIHFAVNCAARSCPVLWPEAYHPDELDSQLDRAVEHFIASESHFELQDGSPPILRVNQVLDWYRDDFGGVEGLKEFIASYLSGERRHIALRPETEVSFIEYDWSLNDTSR